MNPLDLLTAILAWFEERSAPTKDRRYHACPVCYSTWWKDRFFKRERHNADCWVPELQDLVKEFQRMR